MHLEFDMPVSASQSVPFSAILNFFFPSSLGVVRVEKEMQSAILWLCKLALDASHLQRWMHVWGICQLDISHTL
nr:hypothetical protein CFP56_42813 [Quercus suber]